MWWWTSILYGLPPAPPPALWQPGRSVAAPSAAAPARNLRRGGMSVNPDPFFIFMSSWESRKRITKRMGRSAHALEQQQEPAEYGNTVHQHQPENVPPHRVGGGPETVKQQVGDDGEDDEAPCAQFRMPVGEQQGAAGELQGEPAPERSGGRRHAESRHALDVVLHPRRSEIHDAGHEEKPDDEKPSRGVESRSVH